MSDIIDAPTARNRLEELVCDNKRAVALVFNFAYEDGGIDERLLWIIDRLKSDADELREVFYKWHELDRIDRGLSDENFRRAVPDMIPDILESFDLVGRPEGVDLVDAKIATLRASLDAFDRRRRSAA